MTPGSSERRAAAGPSPPLVNSASPRRRQARCISEAPASRRSARRSTTSCTDRPRRVSSVKSPPPLGVVTDKASADENFGFVEAAAVPVAAGLRSDEQRRRVGDWAAHLPDLLGPGAVDVQSHPSSAADAGDAVPPSVVQPWPADYRHGGL